MSDMNLNDVKQKLLEKLQNRYLLILLGIVAFSAFIRFKYAFFEGMWVDESIHGRAAKELPKHLLEYSLPDKGGPMVKRPPVYNYLLAFSNMIFGDLIGTDTAVRIVSPIMSTIGVISTYLLSREITNKKVGLAAAALISVNGTYWFLSERILMGATLTALFTTTLLAFYYGLEDRKYSKYAVWAWGPLIALAALTKQPGYTLGPTIVIYFLYKKRKAINDYLMTDKDFMDSEMYKLVTDRNYYIALGLFMAAMLPWMIRNIGVCQFPLCSFKQALSIAASTSGNLDVQGPLYFILALPGLLSIPLFGFLTLNVIESIFSSFDSDQDLMVKKGAVAVAMVIGVYLLKMELLPLALLSSIALFAETDGEKLLWLSAGLGIGIMSINATKVPRYVVFALPSLITLASISLWRTSSWISGNSPEGKIGDKVTSPILMIAILIPLIAISFTSGLNQVSSSGFQALEPAGEWLDENTNENDRFIATSPQYRYYAYPRMYEAKAGGLGDNETEFRNLIIERNVSYVLIDVYERTQPEWMNTDIPPYRMTQSLAQKIRSGQITGQEAFNQFKQQPDYLVPVQSFGETRIPLTDQNQPEVIIYQVNRSALQ